MRDQVAYRGPDDCGSRFFRRFGDAWRDVSPVDSEWGIGLGHRRLSILDVSRAGHQPMVYRGRFWIIYNGEVYNFIELRNELKKAGHRFQSSSDTEVILAAYDEWGTACFGRFRGMWSLVIVDLGENEVVLCRDRLGMKPLYLWSGNGIVAVASEIKQFRCLPDFVPRMDQVAAAEYVHTGYEDPKRSFFKDVQSIPAASWVKIPLDTLKPSSTEEYWHPERVRISVTDPDEAGMRFAEKFAECVQMHLRSDVPVGFALSGGLDSSAIVGVADALRNGQGHPLHTFTVTFPGDPCDEREWVDAATAHVNAVPHFVTPEPSAFLEDLNRFVWVHDEPVGHLSMYSGYCLARLTREAGVPVTLNGQGGDEILSGYWQTYFLYLYELLRKGRLVSVAGHFAAALMANGNRSLVGQLPVMLRRYRARASAPLRSRFENGRVDNNSSLMSEMLRKQGIERRVHEVRTMFLPRLLKWEDRNSMAFSVEGRYPFLDHELIELCLSFAPETLYRAGWTKIPLRLGLATTLPGKIVHRRSKFGFEAPQEKWLCDALRPYLEQWLGSDRPLWNYLERCDVRRLTEETWRDDGRRTELAQALFRILIFDKWLEIFDVQKS